MLLPTLTLIAAATFGSPALTPLDLRANVLAHTAAACLVKEGRLPQSRYGTFIVRVTARLGHPALSSASLIRLGRELATPAECHRLFPPKPII